MDRTQVIEAFIVDANGIARGKLLPAEMADKLLHDGIRLPCSSYAFDVWGEDVLAAGLVTETGDPDGVCRPVRERLMPAPWHAKPTAQMMLSMFDADGAPFFADPRQRPR